MRKIMTLAAIVAASTMSLAAHAQETKPEAQCAAPKAKKKGGLGGLFAAARRAGLGDMLVGRAGNMMGSSRGAQIAGGVAGAALNSVETSESSRDAGGALSALAGSGGSGQLAAAATGVALDVAKGSAPAGCAG